MHDYSIDTAFRQKANVALALIAFTAPAWITAGAVKFGWVAAGTSLVSFGLVFALLEFVYDRWLWRIFSPIPDLNGKWQGVGVSSYIDPETGEHKAFAMEIIIRQTFTKLEVFTDTEKSTSKSFMASIETEHAVAQFRYGFENTPKNMADEDMQTHSGLMALRIHDLGKMSGDYFSGKFRSRYGEITFTKVKE